ncbi:MAG: DUF488 domain-containing protein [Sedimentisphaerales bacterium]|nr:DUF488 domain-containing protein [Sedimentisphaerales bacterium]
MYVRQKILLSLLQNANKPVDRIVLVKWAFLLSREPDLTGFCAFYDFVPYKYGPFSFGLYHEMLSLEKDGYVLSVNQNRCWFVNPNFIPEIKSEIDSINPLLLNLIENILYPARKLSKNDLIKYIYQHFPWYASRSKLYSPKVTFPKIKSAPIAIYTMGYEGRSTDGFLNNVLQHGIKTIVDVRSNPLSRKYGLSKNALSKNSGNLGIEYKHIPELGIPSERRKNLLNIDDYKKLFNWYEKEIPQKQPQALNILGDIMRIAPTVLICYEKDAEYCHRGRLASLMAQRINLPIKHL